MRSDLSRRLMLSIILLLYRRDYLAAGNEQVCESKLNHDVYVPLNDLSCQDDALDIKSLVVERYKPTRKPSESHFETTGQTRTIHNDGRGKNDHFVFLAILVAEMATLIRCSRFALDGRAVTRL